MIPAHYIERCIVMESNRPIASWLWIKSMKKIRIVTDISMFISMCFLVGTGLLIHFRLVPGSLGGHGLTFLGLTRHEWGTYHLWAAYLLLFLTIVHLVLNFSFIKNVIAVKGAWIMFMLGMIGLVIALLFLLMPIERKNDNTRQHGRRFLNTEANP